MNLLGKIIYFVLCSASFVLLLRYFIWWTSPTHLPQNTFIIPEMQFAINLALFVLLTFIIFIGHIMHLTTWLISLNIKQPITKKPKEGLRVAFLTCYVPGSEPLYMLKKTLIAMLKVQYKHDTWVLDEGNDPSVQKLCRELGVQYFTRSGIPYYNANTGSFRAKTKAGNLNAWRDVNEHNYDVVAQIDMDHIPKETFFMETLGYFDNPEVGFVVPPQYYRNRKNWISRGAQEQTNFFYGALMRGLGGLHIPLLIGTSHIYRVKAMEQIGGYSPNIAEDHLTGLTLHSYGWKSVYVNKILARGIGPLNWADYFNQQMRWSYGLFEILFKFGPKLRKTLQLRQKLMYFLIQLFYFTGVAMVLGVFLTSLYLLFGINTTNINFMEWFTYAFPSYVISTLTLLYLYLYNINPEEESPFGMLGMFLGIGASVIYAIAFFKFVTRQKLTYLVTNKNAESIPRPLPLSVFSTHIALVLLSVVSLIASLLLDHNSLILRFWSVIFTATTTAVIASNYYYYAYMGMKQLKSAYQLLLQLPAQIANQIKTRIDFSW